MHSPDLYAYDTNMTLKFIEQGPAKWPLWIMFYHYKICTNSYLSQLYNIFLSDFHCMFPPSFPSAKIHFGVGMIYISRYGYKKSFKSI